MGIVRAVLLIVITTFSTIFVVQNLASVEVSFLTYSIAAPRAVVFALLLLLGVFAGYLLRAIQTAVRPRPKLQRDAGQGREPETPRSP